MVLIGNRRILCIIIAQDVKRLFSESRGNSIKDTQNLMEVQAKPYMKTYAKNAVAIHWILDDYLEWKRKKELDYMKKMIES